MSKTLTAFVACLALAPALSQASSLAKAAEAFVETALALPSGSARAHGVDPRLSLGECSTDWQWSFPYDNHHTVQVVCPESSQAARRFVAIQLPDLNGRSHGRQALAASNESRQTVVAARDLPFGHIISEADLTVIDLPRNGRPLSATLSDRGALLGMTLTRPLREGEPIGRADARAHTLVKRSALVSAWSEFSGGRVVSKLVALQNGKAGDWIELENPQSGRKLRGQIQNDGSVRLGKQGTPGTIAMASPKVSSGTVD